MVTGGQTGAWRPFKASQVSVFCGTEPVRELVLVSQVTLVVKNPPASAGDIKDPGSIPGSGKPLVEDMATYSIILAWRIPWTEEPGGLQSMGSHRVGHDWSDLAHMHDGLLA